MICSIQFWMKVKMFLSHSKLDVLYNPLWDDSELAYKPSTGVCLYNPLGMIMHLPKFKVLHNPPLDDSEHV